MFDENDINGVDASWLQFKRQFQRTYTSVEEEAQRRQIWYNNTLAIMKDNGNQSNTYSLVWNDFTDMSQEEFRQTRLGAVPIQNKSEAWGLHYLGEHRFQSDLSLLPPSVDWSMAGQSGARISVVTRVKDQGPCGSCWAFSTTGALEGAHAVANGIDAGKISMSEQQLMDCAGLTNNCQRGASPVRAIDWEKVNDVCQEQSYTYSGHYGQCKTGGCTVILHRGAISGHYAIQATEGAHCSALMQRPLSVALNGGCAAFQRYGSGILNNCPQSEDHAVLLVGYGYLNGQKFWKIKNSWGTRWGLNGFGLLARGIGGTDACGVLGSTTGAYVFGPYNPKLEVWDRASNLVTISAKDQVISV
jgi:C1A family cysteine protease